MRMCADGLRRSFCNPTHLNSLPNNKFLDWTKFKVLAEDVFRVAKMMIIVFDRDENIAGKRRKMLITIIFSFSHNVFKRLLSRGSLKVVICGKELRVACRV